MFICPCCGRPNQLHKPSVYGENNVKLQQGVKTLLHFLSNSKTKLNEDQLEIKTDLESILKVLERK